MYIPQDGLALGIDVSHHRGTVDWQAVKKSGVSFGIAKASDGEYFVDHQFDANWSGMRRAGLVRGAYHFFRPAADPVGQARNYLVQVGNILHSTDLPPVLDVEVFPAEVREDFEALPLAERIRRLQACLDTMEQATGRVPMIYTSKMSWQIALNDSTAFSRYPLWVANYEVKQPAVPASNWDDRGWTIWQYTANGTIAGVNGGKPPVDVNVFKASPAVLYTWLGIHQGRPLPPDVSNGEMLAAFELAAKDLGVDPAGLVEKAGLKYMGVPFGNRVRPYDGPALSELPLNVGELAAVQQALDEGSLAALGTGSLEGMTNQEVINLVYKTADRLAMPGWTLLEKAGLADLVEDREASYQGPAILEMSGLDEGLQLALLETLQAMLNPPAPAPAPPPAALPYPGVTNQMMINAFYQAAEQLGGAGWGLVEKAGLEAMADARQAAYAGPALADLAGLSAAEAAAVEAALGLTGSTGSAPYPGLLNQDMINLFYQAAAEYLQSGWSWITRTGMEWMAETREVRYQVYSGPLIEDIEMLNAEERASLQAALDGMKVF
ncbi:MAG: GH25 family lysozyme [Anaerolineae bacterium]|nr:GH25 family lysozyme [Anaerolineae bacterium]